jgi:hypothetical protein
MKLQEVAFNRPVRIFQVFRNIHVYDKTQKSFEDRKEAMAWQEIPSQSGWVVDNELYLPEKILQDPDFTTCNLITLEDDNPRSFALTNLSPAKTTGTKEEQNHNRCFSLGNFINLDIFKLKRDHKELELFLQHGYFEVGIPARDNFKLCTLKKNSPVEIKINGKTESSLSARRARQFKEQHYIIDYLGDFRSCKLLREPYDPVIKQVPANRKVVDLIKPLW